MRKLISILLSALMIMSICAMGISAAPNADEVGKVSASYVPEGTAVSSLAGVSDPAGNYYLTADITLPITIPVTFTGTIDGNGHTITVSAPMFNEFNGTLKNVTIAGSVDSTGGSVAVHTGAVAAISTAGATFENVKNTATVKGWVLDNGTSGAYGEITSRIGTGSLLGNATGNVTVKNCANVADINGYAVGGFVGYVEGADPVVSFENCLNSGKITDEGAVKVSNNGALGGMVGICNNTKNVSFIDCDNTGVILGTNGGYDASNCPAGGLVGYIYTPKDSTDAVCVMKNCTNTADVTGSNQVGGLGGAIYSVLTAENLVNKGNILSTNNYAGGIISRNGCDRTDYKDTAFVIAYYKNCVNYGDVKSNDQYAGGVAGYISWAVVADNCVNYGHVDSTASAKTGHAGGVIALSQTSATITNCYNYGKVECCAVKNVSAGGVMGRAANKGGAVTFERCGNFGEIIGNGMGINYGPGGITGYAWGGNGTTAFRYCFNAGKVTATAADNCAAGIVTYFNTTNPVVFEYNFNIGEVTTAAGSTGYCAELWYNKSVTEPDTSAIHHNYYLAGDGKIAVVHGAGDTLAALENEVVASPVSADDFASGKFCFDLNAAIKAADASVSEDVFYQFLGTDKYPTTIVAANSVVVKNADGSFQNPQAPVVDPTPTGDSVLAVVAIMGVALVTILGTAYITKKVRA